MKPDAQRVAIAETNGWVWYRIPKLPGNSREYRALFHPAIHEYPDQIDEWKVRADGTERICNMEYMAREGHVPDYPNDLNAMHEAEKILKGLDAFRYTQILWKVIQPKDFANYDTEKHVCATAAQRAEAFLRTIGKWRDE